LAKAEEKKTGMGETGGFCAQKKRLKNSLKAGEKAFGFLFGDNLLLRGGMVVHLRGEKRK